MYNKVRQSHGMSKSIEYRAWRHMKTRCYNTNDKDYPNWGGRGITVHECIKDNFRAFYLFLGPRPKGHSLDRIDNAGPYCICIPNIRWADKSEQNNNRRPMKNQPQHGGSRMYAKGCRCNLCQDWSLSYHRAYRAKKKVDK